LNPTPIHHPEENPVSTPAVPPPSKHQLALMIWVAVFPTLTLINLAAGDVLSGLPSVLRTFVLATVAVPIVIYGLMPRLHRLRARLIAARAA
jgi:antibiotic biosynthesis monooxygenase (ABM) superfamily enzyme